MLLLACSSQFAKPAFLWNPGSTQERQHSYLAGPCTQEHIRKWSMFAYSPVSEIFSQLGFPMAAVVQPPAGGKYPKKECEGTVGQVPGAPTSAVLATSVEKH